MTRLQIHTGYLQELDTDLAASRIPYAKQKLQSRIFDAIAFSGMSGAIMAPMIAMALKKPLIMVRKDTSNCHSKRKVEGAYDAGTYIIVDDLVCSGDTCKRIYDSIKEVNANAICVGVYVYQTDHLFTEATPIYGSASRIFERPLPKPTDQCIYTGLPTFGEPTSGMTDDLDSLPY